MNGRESEGVKGRGRAYSRSQGSPKIKIKCEDTAGLLGTALNRIYQFV